MGIPDSTQAYVDQLRDKWMLACYVWCPILYETV